MTREEAARILDPETTRDELWRYEADTRLAACDEACRMGADALRAQQERENPKPITNADRIRAMSDEEMAQEMIFFCPTDTAFMGTETYEKPHYTGLDGGYYSTSEELIAANLKWLQQPAEEG